MGRGQNIRYPNSLVIFTLLKTVRDRTGIALSEAVAFGCNRLVAVPNNRFTVL